jgi:cytochrome c553
MERLHAHHRNGDVTDNRAKNIATVCASCHISGHWAEKRNAVVSQQAALALELLCA